MSEALVERLNAAEIALRDDRPYAAVAIGEAADRIEALEAERDKQREHIRAQAADIMTLGHLVYDDADPPVTWKMRTLTAEAREARLSEANRELHRRAQAAEGKLQRAEHAAREQIDILTSLATKLGHWPVGLSRAKTAMEQWIDARAALSGSVSGWRLVPYLWQCKDYADGWLSYTNEDEAQAYQRDTGCAVRITYRPLPAPFRPVPEGEGR